MRAEKKKTFFVVEIASGFLKVVKCAKGKEGARFEYSSKPVGADADGVVLAAAVTVALKKMRFNHEPLIVALPHSYVTNRYLKLPTQLPREIEKIAALQASRYLPYPDQELITAYQLISTDAQGYAYINLVIVHRNVIDRLLKIFGGFKTKSLKIFVSSYGLSSLFSFLSPREEQPVLLIDIDAEQAQAVIVVRQKLVFSRHFKWARAGERWKDLLLEEIHKTERAYLDEVSQDRVSKIVVTGLTNAACELAEALNQRGSAPAQALFYEKSFSQSREEISAEAFGFVSFAGLVGLALRDLDESLVILPQYAKDEKIKKAEFKKIFWVVLEGMAICAIFGMGIFVHLDNKVRDLARLKLELAQLRQEAKPLEELEQRFASLQDRAQKKESIVELIYELHQVSGPGILLSSLNYEKKGPLVLRGQAKELNAVLELVSSIKKSAVFKNSNVKITYASDKKMPSGDVVDFEVLVARGRPSG